ncbi:Very-short-patch-repair endonuclease [Microlunatus sagamiharensis]|uniref:Very-short-patch-repair endonuclease n=1 Tax=Microlunatus sagamiharensis TaxID=546874 RepID=A0A1H2N3D1_9ACTN|nr:Very-short-patch-repair endonuclease [Microlunatus sagamiharensis]
MRLALRRDGVVCRREDAALRTSIDALVRAGELAPVLPGVYAAADQVDDFRVRVLALRRWCPDAVLTGAAAARLTFRPTARVDVVEAATTRQLERPGFRLVRRRVPDELVWERKGLRLTAPALTALDLALEDADAIDDVLRTRAATLTGLAEALDLTAGRRGNRQRLRHLLDSRDEPWSAAERLCHRLLREAGISGWKANLPVRAGGRRYYLDVAFADAMLVVEIDGRLHEDDVDVFENDRWRQNALVLEGWTVLRFTWAMLRDRPDHVVQTIRDALLLTSTHSMPPGARRHAQRLLRRASSESMSAEGG